MHDVFISYSSLDKWVADAICSRLEQQSIRCWYAPRNIAEGDNWETSIVEAIASAKIFVLIFSHNSSISKQVQREIANAAKSGCVIIPFRIDDAELKGNFSYYLTSVHWLDAMTPPMEQKIETLYQRADALLRGVTPPPPPPPVPKKQKKRIFAVMALVLCIGLVFGIGWFWVNRDKESEVQIFALQDISDFDNYRYPFYFNRMFSVDRGGYFLENRETGNLAYTKTDTDAILLENIDYAPENPLDVICKSEDQYDFVYFTDTLENSVCVYNKLTQEWVFKTPVSLELEAYESIYNTLFWTDYIDPEAEHYGELFYLIYDNRPGYACLSRVITLSYNGNCKSADISKYQLVQAICGTTKGDGCVLMLDRQNNVVVFDLIGMQSVEVDAKTLLEEYMPHRSDNSNMLSQSGRYLQIDKGGRVFVWDLLREIQMDPLVFDNNYSTFFQKDNELVYYNFEDCSLRVWDLETDTKTMKLQKSDFENNPAYMGCPFSFSYHEKLNAYIFVSAGRLSENSNTDMFKLTITDTDGNVLAYSDPLEIPFYDFWVDDHVSENSILLFATISDVEQVGEDGIYTHIYRVNYYYDNQGNLVLES